MKQCKEFQISDYLPSGLPVLSDFKLVNIELPELEDNQVLVKNLWMSVDPYMRGRMINVESYIAPFKLNKALEGGAIGIVESSKNPDFKPGDFVSSFHGWQELFISEKKDLQKIEASEEQLPQFLSVLGMPGLTAYGALLTIGKPKSGETIFVSAASGAVGSLVCQIAKIMGCTVIGSVGSDEKAKWLQDELGIDFAFNYKSYPNIEDALKEFAPDGIDIYFDNVGADHLQAALNQMNNYGRVVMCGMIADYNSETSPTGPNNLMQIMAWFIFY